VSRVRGASSARPFLYFAKMPRIVVTAVHISFKVIERNQDRVNKLVLAMSLGKPTEQHSCGTYCLLLRPTLTFSQKAHWSAYSPLLFQRLQRLLPRSYI
jgi:hypothetical protein